MLPLSVLFHTTNTIPQGLSVARVCEMETKARQLNNRRSKTKSYSPACLRTVQIESKTRRGNCEALRLEIPPPPALLPAWLPPSLASPLRPPPSALPPQCLFRACASGRWRRREGASGRPGGAEVRRGRSLAARAAVIISRKSQFHFHFPTSRQREQQAAARESVVGTPGRSPSPRTHSEPGGGPGVGGRGRPGASTVSGQKLAAVGEEGGYLSLPPRGYPKVGRKEEEGGRGAEGALVIQVGGRCKGCVAPLFSEWVRIRLTCPPPRTKEQ